MRNIWTIAKREYKYYFSSPLAYVIAVMILGVVGLLFTLNIMQVASNTFMANAPDSRMITGPLAFLFLIFTPAVTMRLISDELRMGTMEILLTAPVRDWELVIGKWLGSYLFIMSIVAVSLIYPFMINFMVAPGIDQSLMVSGYLGVALLAAAMLGLGVGISSLFSNQFAAFFATLGLLIVLWWLIGAPANLFPSGGTFFSYMDMSGRFYNSFNAGIVKVSDIVYYLSLTSFGLFVGSLSVEIRRWR